MIALSAELAKYDERFSRTNKERKRAPRAVKKPTVWQRQNPGVAQRALKSDQTTSSSVDPDTEAARIASMEKKAHIYRMIKNGEHVPKHLRDELLVEMEREGDSDDSRSWSSRSRSRSRSMSRSRSRDRNNWDRDESAQLAKDPSKVADDPWVDYEDEFGRTRVVRQSEIPKPPREPEYRENPGIHNPANPFPVFVNQDASRDRSDYVREGGRFYDDTLERRARGAGFYAFSQNEEERERQMKELLELRSETVKKQQQQRTIQEKFREAKAARWQQIQLKKARSLYAPATQ
ncbi:hypothetical protein BGZ74_003928 [Mortierella antarctica]|nr:hypothetical protein BGZ74_003928 [Mortierella antarctica]